MSKIKVTNLPNYSTERFYLLSELEEICTSMSSIYNEEQQEEKEEENKLIETKNYWNNLKLKENETVLVYVLWKEESGIDKLINSIELVLGDVSYNKEEFQKKLIKRILAVEVLLSSQGSWSNELQLFLSENLKHISLKYSAIQYIFGIADNFASPALESLLNIAIQLKKEEQLCRMIVFKSDEYLGHNKNAEPDAISGIFQCLLQLNDSELESSSLSSLSSSSRNILQGDVKINDQTISTNNNKFDLIRSQGIIFLIVASLSWLVYNYLYKVEKF